MLPHIPVMLEEVVTRLAPRDGEVIVDATFGAGGYTKAILAAAWCRVVAFDRDITAIRGGEPMAATFGDRLQLVHAPFSAMETQVRLLLAPDEDAGRPLADAIVMDIGVSSMQLDQPDRGFSFQHDGPLDMRMSAAVDPATGQTVETGPSAAEFVNSADERTIADCLYDLGDEHRSRAIARAIVARRTEQPFTRTLELARLVEKVIGRRPDDPRHPATRTFQALRIHVNDELGELTRGLAAAERLLKPGGRLVVVTFHSLEDRIVKRFLVERSGKRAQGSRHFPHQSVKLPDPSFQLVNRSPLTPSKGELDANPRARSAHLRAARRTAAPPPSTPIDARG
jgi:16S rRNA (cytosine1402-N4)-methyltransferase